MELLNLPHPVKKSDLGFHGNLFGGKLLASKLLLILCSTILVIHQEWSLY